MINKIYDSLKEVYDPEIPLDIVNLGLVKAIDIKENCINIVLMLTSPNCPLQDVIVSQVISKLKNDLNIENINITLDFTTPWSTSLITKEGKEKLQKLGWKI
jgi:Predicted metal-sulfur cluster biosynthetic enzyme